MKKRDVEEWLWDQNTCTFYKPVRKRFPRNPYTVTNIDDVWEMDLADFSSLSKYDDKYKYIFNVIDIFFWYTRSVPLKDKTATSIDQLRNLYCKIEYQLPYDQTRALNLLMQLYNSTWKVRE